MVNKHNTTIYNQQRKLSLLIVFVTLLIKISAQSTHLPKWELQLTAPVYQKAQLHFTSGSANLETASALSFEANLFRRFTFGKHSAFILQLGIGRMAYKLEYEYLQDVHPELPFSITLERHTDRNYDLRRFALGYEHLLIVSERFKGTVSIHLGVRQTPSTRIGFYYDIINPDGSMFYVMNLNSRSTTRLFTPDSELRIGGYYSIGKHLQISVVAFARYSLLPQASGEFVIFPYTPSRTTGTFSLSGSCFGISLGIGI